MSKSISEKFKKTNKQKEKEPKKVEPKRDKPEKLYKIGEKEIKQKTILKVVIIGLIIAIATGGIYVALQAAVQQPAPEGPGYAEFQLIDGETGEDLDGEIMLVQYNDTDKKFDFDDFEETKDLYDNPIKTGKSIYIPESVIAVIWDVELESGDSRVYIPQAIAPMTSEKEGSPYINTMIVYFYYDVSEISANISAVDNVEGDYKLSDFNEDTKYILTLEINVTVSETFFLYGSSSYLPEYYLEKNGYDISLENDVLQCGLWLAINGTDVNYAELEDYGEEYTDTYYIESLNITFVSIDSVFYTPTHIDVTIEFKDVPTGLFLVEGFIEDYENTKVDMINK